MNIAKQNNHGHYTPTQKICYNLMQYDEYDILFIIKFYKEFS
jgi:hypothetical protein